MSARHYRIALAGVLLVCGLLLGACENDSATVPVPHNGRVTEEVTEVAAARERADGGEAATATPATGELRTATAAPTRTAPVEPATSTPTPTLTPSPEPTASRASATAPATPHLITLLQMAVRYGPGTEYDPPVGYLEVDEQASIVGRNEAADGLTWWKIACPATIPAGECWISGGQQYTQAFDSSGVQEAAAPPTPTPSPTHTPMPTPTQTQIPTATPETSPLKRQDVPPEGIAAQLAFATGELPCYGGERPEDDALAPGGVLELGNREILADVSVCLADFAASEPLTVTISSPSGEFVQERFETWHDGPALWSWNPMPGSPLGEVAIVFAQSQRQATARLALRQATAPRIRVLTRGGPAGTTFRFALAGFGPGQPLYLYRESVDSGFLEYLTELPLPQLNSRNEAFYLLPTKGDDPPGLYAVHAQGLATDYGLFFVNPSNG